MANVMFENKAFGGQILLGAPSDELKNYYIKIPEGELRLDDEFLKHEPRNLMEFIVKEDMLECIENGPKDFWIHMRSISLLYSENFFRKYGMLFVAERIKGLVKAGTPIEQAWDMTCDGEFGFWMLKYYPEIFCDARKRQDMVWNDPITFKCLLDTLTSRLFSVAGFDRDLCKNIVALN